MATSTCASSSVSSARAKAPMAACRACTVPAAACRAWPLLLAAGTLLAPRLLLQHRCDERSARIEEQLDTFLLALANALEANPSLGEGLASAARLMPAPLGEELSLVLKQHALGNPL